MSTNDNAEEYALLGEPDLCSVCKQDYLDDDGECDYCLNVYDDDGDVGFQYEHDSSMASVGWGTDEDYGYYGDE
jgi:hypothetical protein